MMSAFMFSIYLATNKIQKKRDIQRRIRGRTEGTTEDRTKRGPPKAKTD